VFIFAHERIADWAGAHLIRPLDDEFIAGEQAQFFSGDDRGAARAGNIYGVPLAFKSVAFDLQQGVATAPPATTDELGGLFIWSGAPIAAAKEFGLAYEGGQFLSPTRAGCSAYGGRLFNERGEPTLAEAGNVASSPSSADLMRRNLLPEEPPPRWSRNCSTTARGQGDQRAVVSGRD
jgi:maltose-binding protein MalE